MAIVASAGLLLGGCGSDDAVVFFPTSGVGVVAFNSGWMGVIDTETQTVSAPFLAGELGNAAGILHDVVITPDRKTALISNFYDRTVFIVDISERTAPVVSASIILSFYALDIALTPNGRFALVTNGAFNPKIAVIDVRNAVLVEEYTSSDFDLDPDNTSFIAIDVAADGATVLAADFFSGQVHILTLDHSGHLTFVETLDVSYGGILQPLNVTISPNGKTALLAVTTPDPDNIRFPVLEITAPGIVSLKSFVAAEANIKACQSVAFNGFSSKAYALCAQEDPDISDDEYPNNLIIELNVSDTGEVSDSGYTTEVDFIGTGQRYGVDTLAIDHANNYLYVSNMTMGGTKSHLQVVDINTHTVVKTLDFEDVEMPPGGGQTQPARPAGVYIR